MIDRRAQFAILYRDFARRLIDLDVLSSSGDPQRLFVQFAAILAALSLMIVMLMIGPYTSSKLPHDRLMMAATGDQQFLIGTTMVIVGIFGVVAWGSFLPDRRDALVLGALPVDWRILLAAKLATGASGLGVSVVAVNVFTGLSYPFLVGGIRAVAAYWLTMFAAGLFVFCVMLAMQGLAALILPYAAYRRASAALQLLSLFAFVAVYFLTPGGSLASATNPAMADLVARFPSYWFLGLFQVLNGPIHPAFYPLARRAAIALAASLIAAAGAYALAAPRVYRRVVEQPDIAPSARTFTPRIGGSIDHAIFLFTARTIARSSQHRLILACYLGLAAAISLIYLRGMIYAGSRFTIWAERHMKSEDWYQPNVSMMVASAALLAAAVIGARAVFVLPSALKANWIFRVTMVHRPYAYFAATRKTLYLLAAAPVLVAAALTYYPIWNPAAVTSHLLVLALAAVILVDKKLNGFRSIPFTCSYAPGKSNLPATLAIRATVFLVALDSGTRFELFAMNKRARFIVLLAVLAFFAVRARKQWAAFAASDRVQFEDDTLPDLSPLDFRRDGLWGGERFIDAVPEPAPRPRRRLLKAAAFTAVLLMVGTAYEEIGGRLDRRGITPVGERIDVGGRSINVSCLGEGPGPAVWLESGGGGIGYYWVPIQREVAKYARVCWYDRAGQGWSDPDEYPRDAVACVRDVRALAKAGAIRPPFVIAGSSFGGLIARVYASIYPDDVAGIVLADSSHMDEHDSIPPAGEMRMPDSVHYGVSVLSMGLWRVGALRFFFGDDDPGPPDKGMTAEDWRVIQSFGMRGLAEYMKVNFPDCLRQARAAKPMKGKPLIVLTAGLPPAVATNPVEARANVAAQKKWIATQRQLLRYSDISRQVVVDSSHCIQCTKPEAILEAIREVVDRVRSVESR